MNKKKQKEPIIVYDSFNEYDYEEQYDEYEQYEEEQSWIFHKVMSYIKNLFEKNLFVLAGSVVTWRGVIDGGDILETYDRLTLIWCNRSGDLQILDDNGELIFKFTDHDGTSIFHIRRLTDAGVRKYEKLLKRSRPKREFVEILMNSNHLSKKINLLKNVGEVICYIQKH